MVHIRSDDDERLRGSLDLGLHRRKTGSASNAALTTSLCTPADASPQTATPASSSSVSLSSPLAASSAPADELFDAEAVLKGAEAPTPIGSAPPIPIPDVDNRSLASIPLVVKALAPGALCLHAAVTYSKHLPSRGTPVSTSATGDAASGTDFASSRQSSSEFVLQAQAAIEMSTMFLLQEQQNFLRTRELEEVCHSLFLPRQPGFHAASAPLTRARKATHSVRPPPQLRVRLRCVAPHPLRLVIHAVSLHTDHGAETGTRSPAMMIAPLGGGAAERSLERVETAAELRSGDEYTCLFPITAAHAAQESLGTLSAFWSRATACASAGVHRAPETLSTPAKPPSQMATPLPPIDVRQADFGVTLTASFEGWLGQQMHLRLHVKNSTASVQVVRASFSENEAFLFCGLKLCHLRLPPGSSQLVLFKVVPVLTGSVTLPPVSLFATTNAPHTLIATVGGQNVFVTV